MSEWLRERLLEHQEQPNPQYALLGTINWMRALAILVEQDSFEQELGKYGSIQLRNPHNAEWDTYVFEQLLMALHSLASLQAINSAQAPYPLVRSAVVSWYYAIYQSCRAMVAAWAHIPPNKHTGTAQAFYHQIVSRQLACAPFSWAVNDLTGPSAKRQIDAIGPRGQFPLQDTPKTPVGAKGAAIAYLSGTVKYRVWEAKEEVRQTPEFRRLGVADFRSRNARKLLDAKLKKWNVNFLTQAFRYRGKANYRDSIYLSYGPDQSPQIAAFISDLHTVAHAFLRMALMLCARRVNPKSWANFVQDLDANCRFDTAELLHLWEA